jgi:hypothetical protein
MTDLGGEYSRIFGTTHKERGAGRSKLCKTCGGWHKLDAWPHNCRPPAPPCSHLSAPQLAPRFEEFKTGVLDTAEVIGDRKAKREFMERHDLVEHDEGVAPPPEPTKREWIEDFVQDFKRAQEEDPLNRPPVDVIGQTDTDGAGEIDVSEVEIIK